MSVSDLIYLIEQAVLLIGQTNNTISYHRCISILSSLMNKLDLNLGCRFIWKEVSPTFSRNIKGEKAIKVGVFIENMPNKHN